MWGGGIFFWLLFAGVGLGPGESPKPKPGPTQCLFEDDAQALLVQLTNLGDGAGQGEEEKTIVFSGKHSLKITQYQRFNRKLPGWNFPIREKPKDGEYRYLRFAWKSTGACLMLQLHDSLDWNIRYTAGANPYGWQTKFLADKAPQAWRLVTVDLYKDFGDRDLTGIAFTIGDGPGFFDHVYLGRTIEDLDRIDATGQAGKKIALNAGEIKQSWEDLLAEDAAVAYRAFWRLVAGREQSVPFLKEKLATRVDKGPGAKEIAAWIRQLDADSSLLRDKASAHLKKQIDQAAPMLELELTKSPSAEVAWRIEKLLASRNHIDPERERRATARRILRFAADSK